MTVPLGTETLDVVVVGDVMVDVLAAMSGPIARGSDTPANVTTAGGGSGANVAAWLAGQGVPTAYVGRVGDDALGRESVAALTDRGVTAWISTDPERATGTCIVLVEPGGERSMLPDAGANAQPRTGAPAAAAVPARRPPAPVRLHAAQPRLARGRPRQPCRSRRAADMTVSVDPSSAALLEHVGAAQFLAMTRGVDLLLANQDEAAVLAGVASSHEAAERLGDTYREVVVKLGADGALWQQGFISASAPAERGVEVVDTTGAGDAFAAGFLASWLLHPEPETALAAGNRLAARAVGKVGARP